MFYFFIKFLKLTPYVYNPEHSRLKKAFLNPFFKGTLP